MPLIGLGFRDGRKMHKMLLLLFRVIFRLTVSIGVVRRPHAKNSKKMTTTAW